MDSLKKDAIRHLLCGLAMGAADAVPGISGGTVALVLGIYRRLVDAVSQVNLDALKQLRDRQWQTLGKRFDIWFLLALATGIGCGLVIFVTILHELIGSANQPATTRPFVYALFYGAIAASGFLVAKMVRPSSAGHLIICIGLAILGAVFAYWLTGLKALEPFESAPNPLVSFLLGTIGICAMILPGISGSYLLLALGAYQYFSGIPKALLKGHLVVPDLIALICFGLGCLTGLLTFSKLLKWMLHRHEAATLSLMGGFMIGALRKLWPWQSDNVVSPYAYETQICFGLMIAGAVMVLVVDYLARPDLEAEIPEE